MVMAPINVQCVERPSPRAINNYCDVCTHWCHLKCGGVSPREYQHIQTIFNLLWTCPICILQLQSLPFANTDNLDSSLSSCSSHDDSNYKMDIFSELLQKYSNNFEIAHLNINSIAGFKLHEIKSWLLHGYFDVLVLTETKLDRTLPNSQFAVDGYRFLRLDRPINGGGVMIYWRSGIIFHHIMNMPKLSEFEAIMIKFKIGRKWLIVIGAYRVSGIPAHASTSGNERLHRHLNYAIRTNRISVEMALICCRRLFFMVNNANEDMASCCPSL